jgi:cadmium resistance protein CadD (predicted permease)
MLIVAMSWAVFWMDPLNVASNVGISITSMLTLIAYRFSADAILPRLPYLTSLDYFILTSTILVFLSLLQCIATSALAKSGESKKAHSLDVTARVLFPVLFVLLTLETLIFRAII